MSILTSFFGPSTSNKNNNNKKEYYLTDIVEYIEDKKSSFTVPYTFELRGINDYQTLKEIEGILNS